MMASMQDDRLDQLVSGVTASAKYRPIAADLVRWIGARELARARNLKDAVKATRNKLHQVASSYQEIPIDYPQALARLKEAADQAAPGGANALPMRKDPQIKEALRAIMRLHASTLERLPILDDFYTTVLGPLGPIHSILDLACGLNPLALPWMPLAPGATYHALDVYQDMVDFLNQAITTLEAPPDGTPTPVDQPGRIEFFAEQGNLLQGAPDRPVQVALLLKTLPCLEQVDKTASARLLDAIQADALVVSYPVASLGGKAKGMRAFYERRFMALAAGHPWKVERLDFPTELVFRVTR